MFYRRLKRKEASTKLQREEYFEKANLLKEDVESEGRAIAAYREKIVSYSRLKGMLESLSMSLTFEDTVDSLCKETADFFGFHDAVIILYGIDPVSGKLDVAYSARFRSPISIKTRHGDLFDRWILKSLQALLVKDSKSDFRFDADKAEDEDRRPVRSLLGVPLLVEDRLVGILRIDSPLPENFTEDDLRLLKTIGDIAAVAIENAKLYDRVEELAIRDSLTGLYLRHHLLENMTEEIARHFRRGKVLSFVMFDLDHFKTYNDRFGHSAGDLVLRRVAEFLRSHFNEEGNIICRYGGEEFAVLLPECTRNQAAEKARSFVEFLQQQEIVLRREKTFITVSAGVAAFAQDAKTAEGLIQKADLALYEAKNKGRNRVCLSS